MAKSKPAKNKEISQEEIEKAKAKEKEKKEEEKEIEEEERRKKGRIKNVTKIKDILQGAIALSIVILLVIKVIYHLLRSLNCDVFANFEYFEDIIRLSTLDLVARALAYSAGVDLAYMLFTPGPDEAIEPLILGLASAILFSISNISDIADLELAKEIGLYVLILFFLFLMKAVFIPDEDKSMLSTLLRKLKK